MTVPSFLSIFRKFNDFMMCWYTKSKIQTTKARPRKVRGLKRNTKLKETKRKQEHWGRRRKRVTGNRHTHRWLKFCWSYQKMFFSDWRNSENVRWVSWRVDVSWRWNTADERKQCDDGEKLTKVKLFSVCVCVKLPDKMQNSFILGIHVAPTFGRDEHEGNELLRLNLQFLSRQHSARALVRFRHKHNSVRVRKTSRFGFKYRFLSSGSRMETARLPVFPSLHLLMWNVADNTTWTWYSTFMHYVSWWVKSAPNKKPNRRTKRKSTLSIYSSESLEAFLHPRFTFSLQIDSVYYVSGGNTENRPGVKTECS